MLPKENRLKKKKDFELVFKKGKGLGNNFLFFKWVNNNLKQSRFGFVVGKKFSKKAVLRNRIKRKIREVIRLNLLKTKEGVDGVFIVKPGIESDDSKKIEEIVKEILIKAKIYPKEQ